MINKSQAELYIAQSVIKLINYTPDLCGLIFCKECM